MIKLTAAISRRDGWTAQEWLVHYKERHASLTASVHAFTRHGLRYLQNYALHAPEIPEFPEANTGRTAVTELWFSDLDAMRTAYAEPDYLKYLRVDELRFCNFDDLAAGVGEEIQCFESPSDQGDKRYVHAARSKLFIFRNARAEFDRDRFQRGWRTERAPELMRTANFSRYVRRYLQTHMLDVDVGIPGGVEHGVIDELWFATTADAIAFWSAYRDSANEARADAAFLRPNSNWVIFAQEHEIFGPLPN